MISDEGQMQAARVTRDAADKASAAADRMEAAAHRIGVLLEDGYGGNGLRLMLALEDEQARNKKPCIWNLPAEGPYMTSCGEAFEFTVDRPKENGVKFCPFCGCELKLNIIT